MDPENKDGTEVLETTVTEGETVETHEEPQITAEELISLREKASKADELEEKNKKLFERAKKAEAKVPSKDGDISNKDILFFAKADIHAEDIDEVTEMARLKKISASEAYDFMKPILDRKAEERKTASATHTKGGARGSAKVAPADLLAQASRNEDIEPTDENYKAIFQERLARKTAKFDRRKR